uniref:Secreted protein n=1 Tax=Schizaphis graminum TaxID=13262 RepID=A0A2S2NLD0_SCHGA
MFYHRPSLYTRIIILILCVRGRTNHNSVCASSLKVQLVCRVCGSRPRSVSLSLRLAATRRVGDNIGGRWRLRTRVILILVGAFEINKKREKKIKYSRRPSGRPYGGAKSLKNHTHTRFSRFVVYRNPCGVCNAHSSQ